MKKKLWLIILVQLALIVFLIFSRRLTGMDILFIYLLVLVPVFLLSNLEFIFKKKTTYLQFQQKKLQTNMIIMSVVMGLIIFGTRQKYLHKDKVVEDLEFMIQTLENVHPDIYHSISRDSFAAEYSLAIEALPQRISEVEFYKTCAILTSLFKSGHTRVMEDYFGMQIILKPTLPYETIIIEDKLYVIANLSILNKIPVGSEILEINGKKTSQLIEEWSKLVSYENIPYRNRLLCEPTRIAIWNDFGKYKVKFKEFGSLKTGDRRASMGIFSNMYLMLRKKSSNPVELYFKEISDNIGYMGFFAFQDLKGYKDFFYSTFSELKSKEINNLIIDIRGNGGGHTIIGAELMQYIYHQPFREYDSVKIKVSNELIATGKVERKLGKGEIEVGKVYTQTNKSYQLRENPNRFKGNTYLITDNGTFSAASIFASSFSCFGKGKIIGGETGGVTVCFGDLHFFNLPNSDIKIMTSWQQDFNACGIDNQRGVIPDYIVDKSIEDYIMKRDNVLDFTIDLINKDK